MLRLYICTERMYSPSIAMYPSKCVCIHASVPQCLKRYTEKITHLKLCLAHATHNFKWVKVTHICFNLRPNIFKSGCSNNHFIPNKTDKNRLYIIALSAVRVYLHPKPSRCIKASFYIPENTLNFPTTRSFRTKISMKLPYQYIAIFFNF